MSPVLADLLALQKKHEHAADWERLMLKMGIALFELVDDPDGERPRTALFDMDEYLTLPGRFELWDGVLHPKHWDRYGCRKFRRAPSEAGPDQS